MTPHCHHGWQSAATPPLAIRYDLDPSSYVPQFPPVAGSRPARLWISSPLFLFRLDGGTVQGRPNPPPQNVPDPRHKMDGPLLPPTLTVAPDTHSGEAGEDGGGKRRLTPRQIPIFCVLSVFSLPFCSSAWHLDFSLRRSAACWKPLPSHASVRGGIRNVY
jgi:hypothetical protein